MNRDRSTELQEMYDDMDYKCERTIEKSNVYIVELLEEILEEVKIIKLGREKERDY